MTSEAAGRFEWERIIRRAQLAEPTKFAALVLATYADANGTRVRPGQGVLAAVMDKSERTVRRLLSELVDLGLIVVVSRGGGRGRRGHTTTYRLAIPDDLLDRVELLPPSEQRPKRPAVQVSGQPSLWEDAQVSGQNGAHPVDNSNPEATTAAGQSDGVAPIDRPPSDTSEAIDRPLVTN